MVKKGFCMGFNLEIAMICPVANLAMTVTFFRLPENTVVTNFFKQHGVIDYEIRILVARMGFLVTQC